MRIDWIQLVAGRNGESDFDQSGQAYLQNRWRFAGSRRVRNLAIAGNKNRKRDAEVRISTAVGKERTAGKGGVFLYRGAMSKNLEDGTRLSFCFDAILLLGFRSYRFCRKLF
jgi:hypothetical protein